MFNNREEKLIYADHSATTEVRDEVLHTMLQILKEDFGNPSSIHQFGRKAKKYLEEARGNIASFINAKEEEIIFTSGGTESNNIVIFGVEKLFNEGRLKNKRKHIISTKIEHPSVKEPLEYLEKKGWEITYLNCDRDGFVNLEELKYRASFETALVTVIHANNEIGTVQDLKSISKICKEKNILFHTDAIQSFGKIPINLKEVNIDFMSISAHKIYGPKGVGALYIRDTEKLVPIFIGGGQENKIRPGTENLAGVAGFGIASKLIHEEIYENAKRLRNLQINLMEGLTRNNDVIITGVQLDKVKENLPTEKFLYRLPGHVSICVKNAEGENLVLQSDLRGILVSSGSACSSGSLEPSHVLLAIGISEIYARGSLRLTLGRKNTTSEVNYIISSIEEIIKGLSKRAIKAH